MAGISAATPNQSRQATVLLALIAVCLACAMGLAFGMPPAQAYAVGDLEAGAFDDLNAVEQLKDISDAKVSAIASKAYTGEAIEPAPTVTLDGKTLAKGTDYTLSYGNNVEVGNAIVYIQGRGSYTGVVAKSFKITKAKNKVKKASSSIIITDSQLARGKYQYRIPISTLENAKATFGPASVSKKAKKYVKLSKSGSLTIKKGLPHGKHTIKVKVKTKATANYKKTTTTVTFKIVAKKKMMSYKSLSKLGVSGYGTTLDAKLNAVMDDMTAQLATQGVKFSKLKALDKAFYITYYIGAYYRYRDGSYSAESMIDKGYGTCFAYSDLTYCMARKAGLSKTWLTEPGRNVDHGGKYYGSQHRSVVAKIGKKYYELDSNLVANMLPYASIGGYDLVAPEQISASYAKYLLGKSKKYKSIN